MQWLLPLLALLAFATGTATLNHRHSVIVPLQIPSPANGHHEGGEPQGEAKATQQQTTADQQGAPYDPAPVQVLPPPQTDAKTTKDKEDHFQKALNDWGMLGFTGLSTAIFLAQLFVFGRQARRLRETIETMRDIDSRQAAAVAESLAVAHRSAKAAEEATHVERAWLFFDGVRSGTAPNATIAPGIIRSGYAIYVQWFNGGRTPAVHVNSFAMAKTIRRGFAIPHFTHTFPSRSDGIIGQGRQGSTSPCFVPDTDVAAAKSRRDIIVVYSVVEYSDVFQPNTKRLSEVTFSFDFNGTVTDKDGKVMDNIDIGIIGPQNACS
jgi:hypothetical protein